MRHVFDVQAPVYVEDSYRQRTMTWETIDTWRGELRPLTAREAIVAAQTQSAVTGHVRLRWTPTYALTPLNRLFFQGRYLQILSVLNVSERNREWDVEVREIPGDPNAAQ
ncbi:MAG TPA: phage head closure protein [Pirellulales bacterium]|nr:phage head closure protein [Pirellulales bacterium]